MITLSPPVLAGCNRYLLDMRCSNSTLLRDLKAACLSVSLYQTQYRAQLSNINVVLFRLFRIANNARLCSSFDFMLQKEKRICRRRSDEHFSPVWCQHAHKARGRKSYK